MKRTIFAIMVCLLIGLLTTSATDAAWPSNRDGILFALQNGDFVRFPAFALDAEGKEILNYAPGQRKSALFGPHYELVLHGGSCHARNVGAHMAAAVAKANAFSLEAWVTVAKKANEQNARIVSFDNGKGSINFELAQDGKTLQCRGLGAATEGGDADGLNWVNLGPLPESSSFHLLISCGDGSLIAYIDGKEVHRAACRDLSGWVPGELVFGDGVDQMHNWAGRLEGIAIYARALSAAEAAADAAFWKAEAAKRKPVPQVHLRGSLVQKSESHPDKMGSYSRAIGLFEYKIEKVIDGEYDSDSVFVFHWTVMNRELQPIDGREKGKTYELLVEPMDMHYELEPELQFDSLDWDYDAPVYYDVGDQQ